MTKPRILITGARGFVGAQVLAQLGDQFDLHAVSRTVSAGKGVTWHDADLRDVAASAALIRDIRPSHMVHSAWETTHGEFWEAESNLDWLEASKALFAEFCAYGGKRIVACGTCAEYMGSSEPLREGDDTQHPPSTYGQSKNNLRVVLDNTPVSYAWARIFYPYGIGENPKRFVPSICQSLLKGEPAKCSSGTQLRNFMDVRDLGLAISMLVEHPLNGPINLGYPTSYKLGDVAMMLGKIANRPDLIKLGALPDRVGEAPVLIPDLSRQKTELKFTPKMTLLEGLTTAYHWWKDHMVDDSTVGQKPL
ncbi:NAD-dependent epimerase/dehydratase family protein [Loktanella sp. S4079]|uniref:NAD-dependent epimerase/dehydratase family protein n=1 Tax=Loktanella sp. S4079 TaxID=579483 RepID=UPI0005FA1135|nr:NAD(P)-dependent oxidoreductase [Loktanella sp. S4079]KJZ18637.1 hypothetical protein TW80_14670 [Loktanella sp. S4079]